MKVVLCIHLYILVSLQGHQEVIKKLVDLIGITSIMEVLIRLIGADDHVYTNYTDAMKWLEDTNVLDMIVDKLTSSDSREVHANAAETLCAIIRYAPPGLAAKVSNPKRLTSGIYPAYGRQVSQASVATANPEIVEGILESLGRLLEMLNLSSDRTVLLTTYGKLQPPLGKHRLKIIEFISVLLSTGSEAAENELVRLGAVSQMLDLFFKYPFNNSLHHHVETIITSCLESKNLALVQHILHDCNLVGRILEAEKHPTLTSDSDEPTVIVDGRVPWKIGNIGHLTRIANKLIHMGSTNEEIQTVLKKNSEWMQWQTNVLSKRNAVENVQQWNCGRPTALQERSRDSDEDDYQDRDYDVAALANNLSQAFRYGIYSSDTDAVHGSLERDDEDVFFDDDASEVVLSSLRLGDDQEGGPIFTNANWFAFEDDRTNNDSITSSPVSPSPDTKPTSADSTGDDQVTAPEHEATKASLQEQETSQELGDSQAAESSFSGSGETEICEHDKPPEQVEWKETETATSNDFSVADKPTLSPDDTRGEETETQVADTSPPTNGPAPSTDDELSQADANDTLNEAPQQKEGSSDPHSHPHSTPTTEDDKSSSEEGMSEP
ncbi:Serine/threonine-protein phosphatase 6 regulatory subunit 3-like protein [Drosera capensis]